MAECSRHGGRETFLSCTSCDRPFCHECLIQGPVGAKCRDCTKGIPVGVTSAERAKANVRITAKDKLVSVKALIALLLAANAVMFNRSGSLSLVVIGPHRYALHAGAIRSGEWYRLLTGAFVANSVVTLLVDAAAIWWVGRMIAPRLGHVRFWAVVVVSLGGGALALLVARPAHDGYGALSLAGGMIGAYLVARQRTNVGALTMPFGGRMGYGVFIVGWVVFSAFTSNPSSLLGLLGGALAAALLATWMFQPANEDDHRRTAIVGVALSALLFGLAGARASASDAAYEPDSSSIEQLLSGVSLDPTSAPTGWMTIATWEEKTDLGDFQTFRLRCTPTPAIDDQNFGPEGLPDAAGACSWLGAHPEAWTAHETPTSPCADPLVWRTTVVGTFRGNPVDASFEGARGCTTKLAEEATDALGRVGSANADVPLSVPGTPVPASPGTT